MLALSSECARPGDNALEELRTRLLTLSPEAGPPCSSPGVNAQELLRTRWLALLGLMPLGDGSVLPRLKELPEERTPCGLARPLQLVVLT